MNCFERNNQYLKLHPGLTGSQCRPQRRGESSIGGTGYSSFFGGNLIKVGGGIN